MSKTTESTSENIQQVLSFGRVQTGPIEDAHALDLDSLDAMEGDIVGGESLPQPVQSVSVSKFKPHLHIFL